MGTRGSGRSCCSCIPRLWLCGRAVAVVGLVCLMLVGRSLGSVPVPVPAATTTLSSEERVKHDDDFALARTESDDHKYVNQQELDFNYMSKRRVPNGPDPIHNRRAGNSGRPPGRA